MKTIAFLKSQLKKPVVAGALLVLFTFIIALVIRSGNAEDATAVEQPKRLVEVSTSARLSGQESLSLIGTVRAFTEAQITSERAGRVTSVNAKLGGTVGAGQVIATLENSAERASVLQAQGGYEAALANSAQSGISKFDSENTLQNAKNSALNTYKSSLGTVSGVLLNNINSLFGNPESDNPWIRFDTQGEGSSLIQSRNSLRVTLGEWQNRANTVSVNSQLKDELIYAETNISQAISVVDSFIAVLSRQDENEYQVEATTLIAKRAELLSLQNALRSASLSISSAETAVTKSEVSSAGGSASTFDAQVKQALGSLRAAQSNLSKTILRSPISGTVNLLDIKMGDFVGSFEKVAIVANNNALEIVTYVGDLERDQLFVGDEVMIEGEYKGIITTIAPAVDSETKKTEVRIATDNPNISNGDTVRISKTEATTTKKTTVTINVPLTAVKFESSDGFIMQVENGLVVQKAVELGAVRGTAIEIKNGLSMEDLFIVDVRGLTPGMAVEVKN